MISKIQLDKKMFKHWWISLVVGILSIAAGICCLLTPIDSLAVLTNFFMIILIGGGIFNIVLAVTNRKWNDYWGWDLARGIIEVMLGIWLLLLPLPLITATMIYVFGFWMLFHSVMGICESCELSKIELKGWGWLLACNIISLLCSFIFLITPIYGGIFIPIYIGFSFMMYGMFRIILAFQTRKFNKSSNNDEYIEVEVEEL